MLYVLATGFDGSVYTVNDPGFKDTYYRLNDIKRA